ncbi:MAG: O-antigen ligase family protein [Patescibacteria group bacterium]
MLFIFATISFFIFCLKDLQKALFFVLLATPLYLWRAKFFGLPTTFLEIMVLFCFVSWLWKKVKQKEKIEIKKVFGNYFFPVMSLLLFSFLAIFFSDEKVSALGIWRAYFLEPIIFIFIFLEVFKKENILAKVILTLGYSSLFVSIPAIVQKFTGWGIENTFWRDEATRRVVSWYGFPNAVGLFLAPIAVIYFGNLVNLLFEKVKNWRAITFSIGVLFSSLLAIIFAQSEGAAIGVAAGCLLYSVVFILGLKPARRSCSNEGGSEETWLKKIKIIMAILPIIFAAFIFSVPQTRNYLIEKSTLSDRSGQIRKQMWLETWQMLKDGRILAGAGLDNYQTAIKKYHAEGIWLDKDQPDFKNKVTNDEKFRIEHWQPLEIYKYPHNIILNFWSEIGLLGSVSFLLIIFIFFYNYFNAGKENKKTRLILLSAVIAILIHGLVDVPYLKNDLALLFFVFIFLNKNSF